MKQCFVPFVARTFHVEEVNLIRWIGQVPCCRGDARGHGILLIDDADLASFIDEVLPDDELLRLAVDQAIGVRAVGAFVVNRLRHVGADFVQLVIDKVPTSFISFMEFSKLSGCYAHRFFEMPSKVILVFKTAIKRDRANGFRSSH